MPLVAEFENVIKVYTRPAGRAAKFGALDGVTLSVAAGEDVRHGRTEPGRQDHAGQNPAVDLPADLRPRTPPGRSGWDRSTLARVGYVHESQAFPHYLSASQLLEYYGALALVPAPVARSRGAKLLERFGLADRAGEPIRRFSKGMLQRLALAQALINDPESVGARRAVRRDGLDRPAIARRCAGRAQGRWAIRRF